ncbi:MULTISPECIES: hypothetical protein [Streptomyces]|uniref:hypothetical protein n=1 Tax=Streptomyces TaxID=1883 RepID=UPI001BECE836|nr:MULTISPECIES: hypothetical protein [Streptomyces]MBT2508780.1 hypothetical protein [Streptomyces sp. ISL-98]
MSRVVAATTFASVSKPDRLAASDDAPPSPTTPAIGIPPYTELLSSKGLFMARW